MRDLRKYAQQTTVRLTFGGILVIVIVAEILIWSFYGREAALFGAVCIFLGLLPLFLTWLFLLGLDWFVKSRHK
ncbi:MAG: hypothetical protein DDG59_02835 [Anaerolineae bacterium]|jgi:uncharacterized SAM-binding protein YcdF (DUF218 family)|nr:MAG: hypothetical protein DDG59_02835 [Anaerolineae bacterium]